MFSVIHYYFLTEWRLKAKPWGVWAVVDDFESLPEWWPGIKDACIRGEDKKMRKGAVLELVVKGIVGDLKMVIEVAEVTPPRKLLVKSRGSLKGFGLCTLERDEAQTLTRMRWEVASTGWLMNLAGLVIRPLLKRRHNKVMGDGYRELQKRLAG